MTLIATTSVTNPLRYPATTLMDYRRNLPPLNSGQPATDLLVLVAASTANTYQVWRSANGGTTWTLFSTYTRANIQEVGSIQCDNAGWLHWVFRVSESSLDKICYVRMDAVGAWSTELTLGSVSNGGSAGSVYNGGVDVQAVNTGPGSLFQVTAVACGVFSAGKQGVTFFGVSAQYGLNPIANNGVISGSRQYLTVATSGRVGPSIDLEHVGDGKTSNVPNLWCTFGRHQIYMAKLAWNGNGWTMPTNPVPWSAAISARDYVPALWTGNHYVCVRPSGASAVTMLERNRANTSTTERASPTHPAGVVRSVGLSYSSVTGNPRVFAVGTSDNDLYYVDYVRATDSWTGWSAVTATDVTGAGVDNYSIRRGSSFNSRTDLVEGHAGVQIHNYNLSLAYAPLAPTWDTSSVPYTNGGAADTAASLLLDWTFNDPDPLDTQSAYALSRQVGSGTLEYWRVSDGTWQPGEVQNTSGTTSLTLTATQWSLDGLASGATDPAHTYRVKTWDSTNVASVYSAGLILIPSVKVNPTISFPPTSSTVAASPVTVTWTVAEQTAYRVQTLIFGLVLQDSGKVLSTDTSYTSPEDLVNTFAYSVKLWTWNNEGLESDPDENSFFVTFVGPNVPVHSLTPLPALGVIRVSINNPSNAVTFVNVGTEAQGNNATLNPALPASMAAGDLMVAMSSIENSGTGTPNTPAGYAVAATFGNMGLFTKVHSGSESAPSCSYTGGAAGQGTSAQMAAWRGAGATLIGSVTQLNGSSQNILYPGFTPSANNCVAVLAVWKQDGAATAFTTPAGMTKIGQTFNANGQSTCWYRVEQTVATAISSGTVTVTSGVSAISRAVWVALSGIPNVSYNDVVRVPGGADFADFVRVAANVPSGGSFDDFKVASRTDYWYRVLAFGDNGTLTYGNWNP